MSGAKFGKFKAKFRKDKKHFGGSAGQGKGPGSNHGKSETKKTIQDCCYFIPTAKQSHDFQQNTEFILNHIKETMEYGADIAQALKELQPCDTNLWKPTLDVSTLQDAKLKEQEQRQFDFQFQEDYKMYKKREVAYQLNLTKVHALLLGRCTKGMKERLKTRKDWELQTSKDPLELLRAIKEEAMSYQDHKYPAAIVLNAMSNLLNCKQQTGESLQDYTSRFKNFRDVMISQMGGPLVVTKMVEAQSGYLSGDPAKVKEAQGKAQKEFLAHMYLHNADHTKYGTLLKTLGTQYSLGNDQYPKTITEATAVLSNHEFDPTYKANQKKADNNKVTTGDSTKTEKTKGDEVNLSFAQMEGKCYCCGKPGHKSPQCRHKDKPKDQWAINKAKATENTSFAQPAESTTTPPAPASNAQPSTQSPSTQSVGWIGAHIQCFQNQDMREWILLDNQSSVTIFCNPRMVSNIREGPEVMKLFTNGGTLETNLKADLPNWGEVWYHPKAITNIFSYAEMADRYRVTYDSKDQDAFIVHLPNNKQVRFERMTLMNLYVHKPKPTMDSSHSLPASQFLTTVEENKTFYTQRQFERAKRARELYHALGTPSLNDFKAIIRMNAISNNPVTSEDIKCAEKIFGPDIGGLKGKTTRRTPAPVVNDQLEIPKELITAQKEVTLSMDGMKVNGLYFLTTISHNLYYRTAQWVPHQTSEVYHDTLLQVLRVYTLAGFKVTTIHCDNEFQPLLNTLATEFHIHLNFANPQEHVPAAERNNRVIKERVRATYHRLPYTHLPRLMVKLLVSESAKKLNFFPAKYGVSPYYSPRMILHQRHLDFAKHCQYAFGAYVQAHEEPNPSNTNAPRTLDCIYLRYNDNLQGGHQLLHLPTNSLITRGTVTPVPITPAIIKQVHALALQEQMPTGLKLANRTGHLFYDTAWIAGVDYDEDAFEDEQDEDYNTEDEESTEDETEVDEVDLDDMTQDEVEEETINFEEESNPSNGNEEEEQIPEEEEVHDEEGLEEPEEPEEEDPDGGDNHWHYVTRSGRGIKTPARYAMAQLAYKQQFYQEEDAKTLAIIMCQVQEKVNTPHGTKGHQFIQTYSLMKAVKKFGGKAKQAALDEMKQLHDRVVFEPISLSEMDPMEKKRALESLMFLTEKRDGRIKARACANGSTQREYIDRDDAASPTAATDSILITGTIDAKQGRDVMTADIPNAFVQTNIDEKKVGHRVIMKIRGPLVDLLLELDAPTYAPFVIQEGKSKVVYVRMVKALYGLIIASLLYYKKFKKDIETIGFKVNPYDPCVANRVVNGKQHTVTWHVDDLKSSHVDPKVNDTFLEWLKKKYADDNIGEVKVTRGQKHDYLAMILDYSIPGVLKVDMTAYVKSMVDEFPEKLDGKGKFPWTENLFKVDPDSKKLKPEKAKVFHTFVMKGMFLCKRGRQDIQPGIAFLSTRTQNPTESDWKKLLKLMSFLKATQDEVTSMSADDTQTIQWHVDAAFAVHEDYRSHTGATMTLGKGTICSVSTKQKVNTRSSTEAELVGLDDVLSKVQWTKNFIQAQGFQVKTVVYRDNTSSMKLEENGRASASKRTRHFNIKYFYITDLIERGEVEIEYCPTDAMLADFMTKPLVGTKFILFRQQVMNKT